MSSPSHATLDNSPPPTSGTLTIALAGNPNSGKTTLFNALTGLRQKVANYPGVTVEKKTGRCKLPTGQWIDVIDLPGTYSLISRSPDEHVAMEVLRGLRKDTKAPDVVIVVVDASNLQRNLYLVSQLIELGRPLVVALNMMDIAERRGINVSVDALQKELGVPVIPVVGYKRRGIAELKAAVLKAVVAPLPAFELADAMRDELLAVGGGLAVLDGEEGAIQKLTGRKERSAKKNGLASAADGDDVAPCPPRAWICQGDSNRRLDRYQAIAERLLIGDIAADIRHIAEHEPVVSLLREATGRLRALGIDPMQADVEAHYRWIEQVAHRTVIEPSAHEPATGVLSYYSGRTHRNLTQKIDAILIHKIWGLLIFALIMGTLFVTLFWLAKPMMEAIQGGIKAAGVWTIAVLQLSDGPLKDLIANGIFAGVGAVVVFVPQIALLFLFLAILEDTGYLARAAFLMDRFLSKVGLHGKSFIPLLSSFACAIPGIMAARTIENRRERLATIMVAPFMSCSARLPVYTLLIGAFFANLGALLQAGIMLACYALGIIAAAATAWVFKRTLTKGPATSFILELPSYKIPQVTQVGRQMFTNTRAFLTKAGTTIFFLSVILWAMAYYPRLPESKQAEVEAQAGVEYANWRADIIRGGGNPDVAPADGEPVPTLKQKTDNAVEGARSEYSISGRMGHLMEPAIRPLGFDWKIGVGLVGAFAAREVFVSSMGIVYSVGEVDGEKTTDLASAMQADRYTSGPHAGMKVWTPMVAVSLLIWFVLAMQCISTFAVVRRETGGWGWPVFMIVYMNALAYVVCLVVYQIGSRVFV